VTDSPDRFETSQYREHAAGDVAAALQAESQGRDEEAVRILERAASAGTPDALMMLGKRHLVAQGVDFDPARAVDLLQRAAEQGNAAAAAQYAVLAAIGYQVKQDWNTALGAVVFAAERGLPAAQGQLTVLADDPELAGNTAARREADYWKKLAATIDLNRWHQPSPGANLCESPLVRHFPKFVPQRVCRWLIDRSRGRLYRARVYDASEKKDVVHRSRSNTTATFNLTQCDLVSVLVQVHVCANTGIPFRHLEPLAVLHYDPGEEILEHYDFIDPGIANYEKEIAGNGQRIVTFLIYLNDDYVGGETALPKLGIAHKGRCGEGLFFVNAYESGEADTRTVHAGRPTTSGEKWIVSQFIRNRPAL